MSFPVGSLVKARGREWVVLPESDDDMIILRPLGGTENEVTGIYLPLEFVEPARFDLPDPAQVGDHRSCRLLRDAVRLSSRASAGPFRSFARIAVEPRPYQLVPLLMALKLDPVRLLIADDVGVGKTIEACLVARELLDRGEVQRLAVLCPPHLAEQWQMELSDKFRIDAELVLPSTASRLEDKRYRRDQSLFDLYPHVVVSLDFIKSDQRRHEFARTCPELVIVDEAHTCAFGYEGRGGRHQRHQRLCQLTADPTRHLILVTATPHSGREETFRSLLSLLDPDFTHLPEDLAGPQNEPHRRRLAAHFVQRRRADIRHFMDTDTPFPAREEREETYALSPEYHRLCDRVLQYSRETVIDPAGGQRRRRVRWWSVLALLRAIGSSPAAAATTLRNRTPTANAETSEDVDELGRRFVFDVASEDQAEGIDVVPGSDPDEDTTAVGSGRRRLLDMAREAEQLAGEKNAKLLKAVQLVKELLQDGYRPILFCRFIPTAEYVARELRQRLRITRRTGAIRTSAVTRRTTLLLVRFRYDIITYRGTDEQTQLAEESRLLAFAGPPTNAVWLDEPTAEALLHAEPDANIHREQASAFVQRVVEAFDTLRPHLDAEAHRRAAALLDAHRRVRLASHMRGVSYRVEPQLPPDVLGIYVYLPVT